PRLPPSHHRRGHRPAARVPRAGPGPGTVVNRMVLTASRPLAGHLTQLSVDAIHEQRRCAGSRSYLVASVMDGRTSLPAGAGGAGGRRRLPVSTRSITAG